MRALIISDEGHTWSRRLDVLDIGGHLDSTLWGHASTLAGWLFVSVMFWIRSLPLVLCLWVLGLNLVTYFMGCCLLVCMDWKAFQHLILVSLLVELALCVLCDCFLCLYLTWVRP